MLIIQNTTGFGVFLVAFCFLTENIDMYFLNVLIHKDMLHIGPLNIISEKYKIKMLMGSGLIIWLLCVNAVKPQSTKPALYLPSWDISSVLFCEKKRKALI